MKWSLRLLASFVIASASLFAEGQTPDYPHLHLEDQGIEAPSCMDVPRLVVNGGVQCTQQAMDQWLGEMRAWRDSGASAPAMTRTVTASPVEVGRIHFMQPQMMMQDRYLYDPETHKYTVDRYLDDLTSDMAALIPS